MELLNAFITLICISSKSLHISSVILFIMRPDPNVITIFKQNDKELSEVTEQRIIENSPIRTISNGGLLFLIAWFIENPFVDTSTNQLIVFVLFVYLYKWLCLPFDWRV